MFKVALITLAAPSESQPLLGVYTRHQADAINTCGYPAPGGSRCEVFIPSISSPRWMERFIPKLKTFNDRPRLYEYRGVTFNVVRGCFPTPWWMRWNVAPRFPRLCETIITWSFERRLLARLRKFKPDALLVHDGILFGLMGARLARKLGVPYGVIEHDPIDLQPGSTLGRYYASTAAKRARAVFTVGAPWLRHMTESLGLTQTRLISNGTLFPKPEHWSAPRPAKWAGKKIVLCVGGYLERKAHTMLIRAFCRANVPGTHLVIVGRPPAHVRAAVDELNAYDRVEFTDFMSQDEVLQHMVWADLFCLPSWWESFGLVYAEAMAGETPVIMTTDCGMTHYIRHGVHGWIIEPHSEDAVVAALTEALTKADLKSMGKIGRAMVEKRLTWRNNALQVLAGLRGEPEPRFD